MGKTKKEQGWQNPPQSGAYTLTKSVIVAEKPERLKRKEQEEIKRQNAERDSLIKRTKLPWSPGYDRWTIRRSEDGGIIRLKRK